MGVSVKQFSLVFLVLALSAYGLWYITYRRYDLGWVTDDSLYYVDLVAHLTEGEPLPTDEAGRVPICSTAPLRYRVLTPLMVRGLSLLQLHRIWDPGVNRRPGLETDLEGLANQRPRPTSQSAADIDPREYRRIVYYFTLVDYLLMVAAATVWFFFAQDAYRIAPYLALAGSLAFLLTYYNLVQSYQPHSDAGAHLLIVLLLWAYVADRWGWFFLGTFVSIAQKETILIVVGAFLLTELMRRRWWALKWLAALVPALALYRLLWVVWPLPANEQFEASFAWLTNLLVLVDPRTYFDPQFVMPHLIGNLPLLAALAAHAWLKGQGITVRFPMAQLLVFPMLFLLGTALTVNTGRVASLGTAIYLGYEVTIVAALLEHTFSRSVKPTLATLP
jgi:hypothetical protein